MKSFVLTVFLVVFVSALSAESFEKEKIFKLNKPVPALQDMSEFIAHDLPGMIALDSSRMNGHILKSFAAGDIKIHRIEWKYKGIPVIGKYSVIKEKNGVIYKVINTVSDIKIDTVPKFTALAVASKISNKFLKRLDNPVFASTLVILYSGDRYRLAYRIRFKPASLADGNFYYIDAHTGSYLGGGNFVLNESSNTAKVFETNPVRNPEPVEVELPWIGDDAAGKLSSAVDETGGRKVVSTNCPDMGETTDYYGQAIPICTPTQLANKDENGSFVYEDWTKGVDFSKDFSDVYAEVSAYYHMSKIYSYILGLGIEEFQYLDSHVSGVKNSPMIAITNFQMAASSQSGTIKLAAYDNAGYSPYDPAFSDLFFKNFEHKGDTILIGQGSRADYAYDGDVIYHEFGHGIVESTAKLSAYAEMDKYGYSNESLGLNEGIADTFSFLISGDSCLGEYVAGAFGAQYGMEKSGDFYCLRLADNGNLVNEDFNGESHNDGLPAVSAHWAMYQKTLEKGHTKDEFVKYFMNSLLSVVSSSANFQDWANVLIDTVDETPLASLKNDFQAILEERGFFNEIRARNITHKAEYIMSGGISQYQGMPADTIKVEIEGSQMEVGPMYIQLYYDVPECIDTITITGMATDGQSMSGSTVPRFGLLARKDKPVIWTVDDVPFKVDYDSYIMGTDSWTVKNLVPGSRYYFQFTNTGPAGMLYDPQFTASWTSSKDCAAEVADSDSETTDDLADIDEVSDEANDEEQINTEKNKDSGCALIVI